MKVKNEVCPGFVNHIIGYLPANVQIHGLFYKKPNSLFFRNWFLFRVLLLYSTNTTLHTLGTIHIFRDGPLLGGGRFSGGKIQ